MMYIPIILGTAREGRQSEKVAYYLLSLIQKRADIKSEIIDVRNYIFGKTVRPEDDGAALPWREMAKKAEGFIIVSPEYNHDFPGELKIALDSAYDEYENKPVVIAGVSSGIFGGARMVEALINVLRNLGMKVMRSTLNFGKVEELFDKEGKILDTSYEKKAEKCFDDLVWHVKTLKYGMENFK